MARWSVSNFKACQPGSPSSSRSETFVGKTGPLLLSEKRHFFLGLCKVPAGSR